MKSLKSAGFERPVKVASIDLDGTLLDPHKNISLANQQAVGALRSSGFEIVLTTGRILQHTLVYYRMLGLHGPVVSSDGALVRVPGRKAIQDIVIDREVVGIILQAAKAQKITALSFRHAGVATTSKYDWNDNIDRHRRELPHHYRNSSVSTVVKSAVHKVLLFAERERLQDFESSLPPSVVTQTNRIRNWETLEFTAPGIDKVAGLACMFEPEEVTFFGDGNNDAGVLAWAHCGIAMHHGSERAREAADYVAPESDPSCNFAEAVRTILQV